MAIERSDWIATDVAISSGKRVAAPSSRRLTESERKKVAASIEAERDRLIYLASKTLSPDWDRPELDEFDLLIIEAFKMMIGVD